MSLINVANLTFCYEGSYDDIFKDVSFQIDTGWRLGLIGRNGRGKTTFLNLLMGKYEYAGSITASVPFDYFPFEMRGQERMAAEIAEEADPGCELWKVCRELSLLDVDPEALYRPFETLSQGERTKVMLAILFSRDNHFLLIDEPTNHLDRGGRQILMNYLNQKSGFLLVSHDRIFLDGCVDHILAVNKQDIQVTHGNFSVWWENKKNRDAFEMAENERLKREIRHLSKASERTKGWSDQIEQSKIGTHTFDRGFIGRKSAKMMKRAKNAAARMEEAAREKSQLLKNVETADRLKLFPLKHEKDVLVRLTDISIRYGQRVVTSPVGFTVRNGQRILLQGKNGCGKSSILKAVLGENRNYTGTIDRASGLIISYVSQDTSFLTGTLEEFIEGSGLEETLFKALLRRLDFSRVQFGKRLEEFSGGQKKKVLIARSLCQRAHLYLWDEPLNYIDLFSRMQIERLILEFCPTMLFVEHDRMFTDRTATDVIRL